jgi:hypothetical protein
MKKLLLIVFVLAICVLAFSQGVMADTPVPAKEVAINAKFLPKDLVFDAQTYGPSGPGSLVWDLHVDPENSKPNAIYLKVDSSRDWEITAYDKDASGASPKEDGKLLGDQHSLQKYFLIAQLGTGGLEGSVFDNIVGGSGAVTSIVKGGPLNVAQFIYPDVKQEVTATDFGSKTGYKITIVFTCTEALPGP